MSARPRPHAGGSQPSESEREEEGRARGMRRSVSESERSDTDSRRSGRSGQGSRRDRDEKRPHKKKGPPRRWWQRMLLAVLFFCGPVGTIVSFWLLPKEERPSNSAGAAGIDVGNYGAPPGPASTGSTPGIARMVHLTLVGSSRRARFVLDEHTDWDTFIAGCRERLQVETIRRVTDSSGEAILAVEDLVHDDHIVIHADIAPATVQRAGGDGGEPLGGAAEAGEPAAATEGDGDGNGDGDGGGDGLLPAALPVPLKDMELRPRGGLQSRSLQSIGAASANSSRSGGAAADAEGQQQQPPEGGGGDNSAEPAEAAGALLQELGNVGTRQQKGARPLARSSASSLLEQLSALHPEREGEKEGGDAHGGVALASSAEEQVIDLEVQEKQRLHPRHIVGSNAAEHEEEHHAPEQHRRRGHEDVPKEDEALGDLLADPDQPAEICGKRHPMYRVAMLVPWVNELPPWLSYFITTAKRSEYLVDWLVFHETLSPPSQKTLPANVRFIDLGQGGLAQLFGLKMGEELGMPVRNASLLIRSMRFMLEKWPRLVAEYKPAFGSIFEQYLADYTHWGYCDLDMVIGNIPLFLEQNELEAQDIVTYSFGDVDALYLRGQWTVHRNTRTISVLWKGCPHLGEDLQKELLMKVAWVRRMESRGIKNYPKRFQSAEGCYSHRAAMHRGIRMKMAHKQFVGLSVPSEDVIYFVNGAVWQCPKGMDVSMEQLLRNSQQPCAANLPGVQEPLGEMLPLQVSADGGCGKWMPVEYRMCAVNLPEPPERERDTIGFNTYLRDGKFYAQRYRSTLPVLDNGCRQGAFFHMQEWKKIWGYGTHGVDPLELALATKHPPMFTVTTEGITLLT